MDGWNRQSESKYRSACEELYGFATNWKVLSSPALLAWIGTTKNGTPGTPPSYKVTGLLTRVRGRRWSNLPKRLVDRHESREMQR